jgi:NAD(P)H-flavin reductase
MLRTLARRPNPPRTILVHGAARMEDLVCGDEIAALAAGGLPLLYVPTVSRPDDPANGGWRGRTGRAETVLGSVLRSVNLPPNGLAAFLCGNPGMVAAAEIALLAGGVAPGDIHAERYWTAPGDPSAAGPTLVAGQA